MYTHTNTHTPVEQFEPPRLLARIKHLVDRQRDQSDQVLGVVVIGAGLVRRTHAQLQHGKVLGHVVNGEKQRGGPLGVAAGHVIGYGARHAGCLPPA